MFPAETTRAQLRHHHSLSRPRRSATMLLPFCNPTPAQGRPYTLLLQALGAILLAQGCAEAAKPVKPHIFIVIAYASVCRRPASAQSYANCLRQLGCTSMSSPVLPCSLAGARCARLSVHGRCAPSDDFGWHNIGWRNPEIRSPNIDALAADGIKLDRHCE